MSVIPIVNSDRVSTRKLCKANTDINKRFDIAIKMNKTNNIKEKTMTIMITLGDRCNDCYGCTLRFRKRYFGQEIDIPLDFIVGSNLFIGFENIKEEEIPDFECEISIYPFEYYFSDDFKGEEGPNIERRILSKKDFTKANIWNGIYGYELKVNSTIESYDHIFAKKLKVKSYHFEE